MGERLSPFDEENVTEAILEVGFDNNYQELAGRKRTDSGLGWPQGKKSPNWPLYKVSFPGLEPCLPRQESLRLALGKDICKFANVNNNMERFLEWLHLTLQVEKRSFPRILNYYNQWHGALVRRRSGCFDSFQCIWSRCQSCGRATTAQFEPSWLQLVQIQWNLRPEYYRVSKKKVSLAEIGCGKYCWDQWEIQ